MLMGSAKATGAVEMFERLQNLEDQKDVRWLG
jgi:hypothetical protein